MSLLRHAERCFANQQTFKALNAFIPPAKDNRLIRQKIQEADDRRSRGEPKSPIDGRLIAIKDNICSLEEPTTCASAILDGFISPYAATVVDKLQAAGAVIAGKTNLDEFGMGSHSTNTRYGAVQNVYNIDGAPLSAGGSSGGSAVAVATGQCYAALGTDTGGSVRLPAAYTGIVGFKPSYGMVSRWGVVAYANSLDTVGVLASHSQDVENVFNIINGYDARDPTSVPISTRSKIAKQLETRPRMRRFRIGIPRQHNTKELEPTVRNAWVLALQRLQDIGHSIHQVSLPATNLALSAYYIIAPAEASSNLAKYDGVRYGKHSSEREGKGNVLYATTRGAGLGEEVKKRILLGAYSLSAAAIDNYFIKAQKVRRLVQQDFDNVFSLRNPLLVDAKETSESGGVDVLLSPTGPTLPPKLASIMDRRSMQNYSDDVLTVPASLAGLPAMSVPVSISRPGYQLDDQGPVTTGMQIIAQYGDEESIFEIARVMEHF